MNNEEQPDGIEKCQPSAARFCQPLLRSTQLLNRIPMGLGWVYEELIQDGVPTMKFRGLGLKTNPVTAVLVNYCPFCGNRLRELFDPLDKPQTGMKE